MVLQGHTGHDSTELGYGASRVRRDTGLLGCCTTFALRVWCYQGTLGMTVAFEVGAAPPLCSYDPSYAPTNPLKNSAMLLREVIYAPTNPPRTALCAYEAVLYVPLLLGSYEHSAILLRKVRYMRNEN
eukprot:3339140-Rhodomonas_salina.2